MPPQPENRLLTTLIMTLGFLLGFFYNSQIDPTTDIMPVPAQFQLTTLKELDGLHVDYSLLTDNQFRALKVFGSLPVSAAPGGKSDPFQ